MKGNNYTPKQNAWLRDNRESYICSELTERFNARFNTHISVGAIQQHCLGQHIKTGRTGQFRPGLIPWNTGITGFRSAFATEFKPGNRPHNTLPVGSERITKDGIHQIKIADPKTWRSKHALIWQELHGDIPPGSLVIFADGDKTHFNPDNLILVSRAELANINRARYGCQHPEIKPLLLAVVKLEIMIRRRLTPGDIVCK